MKLQDLLEYRILKIGSRYADAAAKQGEEYADKLTYIVDDGRIKIGYRKPNNAWISIYLFVDGEAEGALEVSLVTGTLFGAPLRKLLGGRPICIPHIAFTEKIRGKGYASAMYRIALDRGCVFVTSGHTKDAKALWDSLKEYDHMYFANGELTDKPSKDAFRLIGKNLK